jgi:pimeloyl-ACP methyl ester carboxylesterase
MRAGALAVALLALVCIACTSAEARPVTQLVDVGGFRLSVTCRGEATSGPAVIIEAGRGNTSGDWQEVEPEVAKFARVCSYDRAGLGASDARPGTATGDDVARELHTALANLDIEPPYVIAAHSIGVLYARLFAENYRDDVAGLVFADGSDAGQFEPGREDAASFGNEGKSRIDLTSAVSELRHAGPIGDLPLVVLHGGAATDATWLGYHYQQALLSDNSEFVIAKFAGHFIYDDAPGVVIDAIRLALNSARSGQWLAPCEDAFAGEDVICVPLIR